MPLYKKKKKAYGSNLEEISPSMEGLEDSLGHPTHTSGVLTTLEQGYTDSYIKSYLVSSFELPANN